MMDYSGVYVARMDGVSISTARTLLQVKPGTSRAIDIIRCWVNFNSITSTAIEVRLKDASTDGTSTSFTPVQLRPGSASANATAGHSFTSTEPTLANTYLREWVNYLNGYLYLPVPEERVRLVASGNRFGIDLPTAPGAAVTINAGIVWGEIG